MQTCPECGNEFINTSMAYEKKYCGNKCRDKHNNNKKKALKGITLTQVTNPSKELTQVTYPSNAHLTSLSNNQLTQVPKMNSPEEYLYRQKIDELKATIVKLETAIDKKETKFEAITKEKDAELKKLTKEFNDLTVTHNTIAQAHAQELNGVEQNRKSLGRELMDLIKDKDAMGNVLDAVAVFKGEERSHSPQIAGTDSEDLQAVRNLFSKLGNEHQKMFVNSLYIYGKRPDLLEKQAIELEQIINGAK